MATNVGGVNTSHGPVPSENPHTDDGEETFACTPAAVFNGFDLTEAAVTQLCEKMSITVPGLADWLVQSLDNEHHEAHMFVDGGLPLTMAVNHGRKRRFLLVPRPDGRPGHYGLPHFGSEEERQCDAFMIARAAESDEGRAQLEEWNKLLELKPTDDFTDLLTNLGGIDQGTVGIEYFIVLGKIRGLTVYGREPISYFRPPDQPYYRVVSGGLGGIDHIEFFGYDAMMKWVEGFNTDLQARRTRISEPNFTGQLQNTEI